MPSKRKLSKSIGKPTRADAADRDTEVTIVGGLFRGRRLRYHGDPVVRPMKHRTRESIFNLISTEIQGRHAIDLFAGTGALGLEALSRGAASATFIEKHVPSAHLVQENIAILGVEGQAKLLVASAFVWAKRDLTSTGNSPPAELPWLVFCSPPYSFYTEKSDEMLALLRRIQEHAPADSLLVVEADESLDFGLLTFDAKSAWDIRTYPPAVVGVWRRPDRVDDSKD